MYRTPEKGGRSIADLLLGWSAVWYYTLIIGNVAGGAREANRGTFDSDNWLKRAFFTIRAVERMGGSVIVDGADNLKDFTAPAVFVANHMSALETMAGAALVLPFSNVSFVVKESLLRHPLMGPVLRASHILGVTRKDPREDLKLVLEKGTELLKRGTSMMIFPQSTRTVYFDASEFNSLGVKLARRAGVPIVPVALKTDFQRIGKWVKDLGGLDRKKTVRFRYGPIIQTPKGNGKEEHNRAVDFIARTLAEWGVDVRGLNNTRETES